MKINRIISKISACAAALCMIFGNAVISGGSHDAFSLSTIAGAVSSGTCGEALTWELSDGTLTISGTGDMYDFSYSSEAPWYDVSSTIQKIILEDGVTSIGKDAFLETDITEFRVPDSVTRIDEYSFEYCDRLKYIVIPDSVTLLRTLAFNGCRRLKGVLFCGTEEQWDNICDYSLYEADEIFFNYEPAELVISGNELVRCVNSSSVVLVPDTVTSIAANAFTGNKNVETVIISDLVTEIGTDAFEGCTALTEIRYDGIPYQWGRIRNIENAGISSGTKVTYNDYVNAAELVTDKNGGNYIYTGRNYKYYKYDLFIPENIAESLYIDDSDFDKIIVEDGTEFLNLYTYNSEFNGIEIPDSVTSVYTPAGLKGSEKSGIGSYINYNYIYGYTDSYAQIFAETYGVPFISIGQGHKPDEYGLTVQDGLTVTRYRDLDLQHEKIILKSGSIIRKADVLEIEYEGEIPKKSQIKLYINGEELTESEPAPERAHNYTISYDIYRNVWYYKVGSEDVSVTYNIETTVTGYIAVKLGNYDAIGQKVNVQFYSGDEKQVERDIGQETFIIDIPDISKEYLLRISSPGCVTREYPVRVSQTWNTQDVYLLRYGDSDGNGLIEAKDAGQILRYEVGLSNCFTGTGGTIDEYAVSAANVLSEDGLNARDATQILRHDAELTSIFDTLS